jgi:hypothetical protein
MNDLERQLLELGTALQVPAAPDLMGAVSGRLPPRTGRSRWIRRPRLRRPVAIGLAVGVALAGTAAAVPPVRHAIERVFGLGGTVVERVRHLPPPGKESGGKLDLGRRIPVADAAHAASFRALLPPRGVNAAYVSAEPPGGRITLVVGRSLVIEFRGQPSPFVFKMIGPNTRVRHVRVNGGAGLYIDRSPHEVVFVNQAGNTQPDPVRLKGSVLLWPQHGLVLRIERAGSLAHALALARSLK